MQEDLAGYTIFMLYRACKRAIAIMTSLLSLYHRRESLAYTDNGYLCAAGFRNNAIAMRPSCDYRQSTYDNVLMNCDCRPNLIALSRSTNNERGYPLIRINRVC